MLKAIPAASIVALLAVLAIAAVPSGAQSGGNPCTPRFAGANVCSVITIDGDAPLPAAVTSRVTARFNGNYDAQGCPVFVATTNPVAGGIVVGNTEDPADRRLSFSAPTTNDQSALDGRTIGYSVDARGQRTLLTIRRVTAPTDSPSVALQQSDLAVSFVQRNNNMGDDVLVPIERNELRFDGTVQGEFRRDSWPVPNKVC